MPIFARGRFGLLRVEHLLGLLDERQHVAHAEDRGRPSGRGGRRRSRRASRRWTRTGSARRSTSRTDRAAPPRASPSSLVSTTPVNPTPSRKASAVADRVLADHRVEHEQHLVGVDGVTDRRGLGHQLVVDAEPAGGVDDHHVEVLGPGLDEPGSRYRDRITGARVGGTLGRRSGVRGEHLHARALTHDLQLADRARTLQVRRDEQRRMALSSKPFREFAGQRRLTRALKPGQHDDGRRGLGERQLAGLATEDADELLVDDLDDLLGRVQRRGDLGALGPLLDAADELAHHGQRNVGFEQSQPDLAGGRVDVGVGTADPCRAGLQAPVNRSDRDSNTTASLAGVCGRLLRRCRQDREEVTFERARRDRHRPPRRRCNAEHVVHRGAQRGDFGPGDVDAVALENAR